MKKEIKLTQEQEKYLQSLLFDRFWSNDAISYEIELINSIRDAFLFAKILK